MTARPYPDADARRERQSDALDPEIMPNRGISRATLDAITLASPIVDFVGAR
jgi:hypothetical protein